LQLLKTSYFNLFLFFIFSEFNKSSYIYNKWFFYWKSDTLYIKKKKNSNKLTQNFKRMHKELFLII